MTITAQRLREVVEYDESSGAFSHKVQSTAKRVGLNAGTVGPNGYVYLKLGGKRYLAHRLAWLYVHGTWPMGQIDHINGVRNDNRIANLRDVSASVNLSNTHAPRRNSKTGLVGVQMNRHYFYSRIVIDGKRVHLGMFKTPEEASAAYLKAKQKEVPA